MSDHDEIPGGINSPHNACMFRDQCRGNRAAYEGAREDLLAWKRRALEAEAKLRTIENASAAGLRLPVRPTAAPLTAEHLADALEAFWNAALGAERNEWTPASCIAEGFQAVARQLREKPTTPAPAPMKTAMVVNVTITDKGRR